MKPTGMKSNTKILSKAAVAVALAGVLNFVKIYPLPQTGSITAGAMVPVLWFALRRGAKWGVLYSVNLIRIVPAWGMSRTKIHEPKSSRFRHERQFAVLRDLQTACGGESGW